MNRPWFIGLVVLLIATMMVPAAFAQSSTTGSIEGFVHDPSGAAVPGVFVTATSPNMIRPTAATTGSDGRYTLLNLPPGTYTVTVSEAKGFGKTEQKNITVNLSRTTVVDLQLQLAAAQTEVTVSTAPPAVDTSATTSGSNVNAEQFSNFPTARTVQGLFTIAPSVARSGLRDSSGRDRDPSVAGSSGPENNYILDGVSVTDPAYGGGGANMPFEFVQEVEVKTGAYSAEFGKSTGGIFNVVTKSGGNAFHGDIFAYFTPQGAVRSVRNFPFTGGAANGFSEKDFGGDVGGPIKKNKLWFFGAINPQFRTNNFLTQTFHDARSNDVTIPFYAGKLTWSMSDNSTLTFSTFSDYTTIDGFITGTSGFGSDPKAFEAKLLRGGQNYAIRLNSAVTTRFIVELAAGFHFQRVKDIPRSTDTPLVLDSFAVYKAGTVLPAVNTGYFYGGSTGYVDYVDGRGGSLERNFLRGPGYGLFANEKRNRYEFQAHLQNTFSKHSLKYGFEISQNLYNDNTISTGNAITYGDPNDVTGGDGNNQFDFARITNNFSVCAGRGTVIVCPSSSAYNVANAAFLAGRLPADVTAVQNATITTAEAFTNPFIFRLSTRVRDYQIHANTHSRVESAYIQDNWNILRGLQLNLGARWDFQTAFNTRGETYLKLNRFWDDFQPRLGLIWDFTGNGKGKFEVSYARFLETPIPLDMNVRAGGGTSQTDKNINVDTYGAPASASVTADYGNLGYDPTPVDNRLKPPMLEEYTAGVEYAPTPSLVFGVRGVYRNYVNIVEDGSFDDGNHYFLFNPGRRVTTDLLSPNATTEDKACADPTIGCFGKARRYYRAIEFTATKRWSKNFQFISSYTYSSLIGNYEGLYRNDNGQSDPNITSLFDLVSLMKNTYGRLPNDRPHQFKFNGSYRTPLKDLMVSGNFYIQSGTPFNQMIPHPVYGNNEGFALPRGTAIVPAISATVAGFPNYVNSVGTTRGPVTSNVDLGFYYPVKIKEGRELRLSADWFNVFNQQRAVTLDQTYSINSGITGVPPTVNPFWGSAVIVQPPSQWRFGAKFSF